MNYELEGGRVYVDNGPVQMMIYAERHGVPMQQEAQAAAGHVGRQLEQLAAALALARQPWPQLAGRKSYPGLLLKMYRSVQRTEDPALTPMAAVAGTFADAAADHLVSQGATKVMVNNGGDIALRLAAGEAIQLGIAGKVGAKPGYRMHITHEMGFGGVATSGMGGRSLTLGVADAVVAFASTASLADACATHIANTTAISSPAVSRRPAKELDEQTDIPELLVTTEVGSLSPEEISTALTQGEERARYLLGKGVLKGAILFLQGQHRSCPGSLTFAPIRT